MQSSGWSIVETEFCPRQLHSKETVFTIGNGYLGTRGSFEEGYPGAMPATLINGVYDAIPICHTELVNCPDWLPLVIRIKGEYFSLNTGEILSYRRCLDMRRGVLSRDVRWRSPKGHTLDFYFERFASMADDHLLALRCQITPVDFEGSLDIQAGINGYSDNQGMRHWEFLEQGEAENTTWLKSRTRSSHIDLAMAVKLNVIYEGEILPTQTTGTPGYPTLMAAVIARPGQKITVEKFVTLYTTRETPDPLQAAKEKLASLPDWHTVQHTHEVALQHLWENSDIVIEGDLKAQQAVRHGLFQLLAAAPRHDDRVGIPAKTLSGFAYKGHNFWDTEIFVVPFLTYTQPQIARNLLTYRYHTLAGARRKAQESGFEGAMFAWESADTGDEVTPRWVPGPAGKELIRIWCGDIELHITSDVAYALWHYWQITGDNQWMCNYGAEILLDTAVFWGSRVEERHSSDGVRYQITDVIGPDEYHDRVDNNAFTNRMVQWHLEKALSVLDWLKQHDPEKAAELNDRLDLNSHRLARWQDIIDRMWVSYNPQTGLIEQHEGFFKLEDIDLAAMEPRTKSVQALLGIEGAAATQTLKQADVLMLMYLLRERFERSVVEANWDYYNPRTDHTFGSSLSPAIHAILACSLEPASAYEHFMRAALVDVEDVRRNAGEGIHSASAGGVWQAVVFGFAGVVLTDAGPVANPNLPPHWTRLQFKLNWQGRCYEFDLKAHQRTQSHFLVHPRTKNFIQGVIFDLDGVITDTAKYHYLAWKQLADEEGIPFDEATNEQLRGVSRGDSLRYILGDRKVSDEQFQAMMDRKNAYYVEFIKDISPADLLPGAGELLDELHSYGVKVALGSASKNARDVIAALGIADKFDAVADGYSVVHSKPAPDLFLHAADLLGLSAKDCAVVEDAAAGVEAALAAGMWAVGLGPASRIGQAHVILPNLEGIFWDELLARLVAVAGVPVLEESELVKAG
ncbi:beta-phosphoglucomutase [Ancylothrix sp. C2]|uniref:beta-phosphoglucomutase n=1 Tax=Ancylothrix sp. D3o TaxID=2953691 RepID=UPI0021BBA74B|nr:beta-phosphoglucomutase [Ancylothrix sp. D3o]MCT7949590.1 beta-phosphoglucomutase [Ancylothrix sp. D3o]